MSSYSFTDVQFPFSESVLLAVLLSVSVSVSTFMSCSDIFLNEMFHFPFLSSVKFLVDLSNDFIILSVTSFGFHFCLQLNKNASSVYIAQVFLKVQ